MRTFVAERPFLRCLGLTLALTLWANVAHPADVTGQATVTSMTLVSSVRISRTVYEYTYSATVKNEGAPLAGVIASVLSSSPATEITDAEVVVGDLDTGEDKVTADTFAFRHDRSVAFDASALRWSIAGTVVGQEGVLLDGSPNSAAVTATIDRVGEAPSPSAIAENGLMRTRLTAQIDPASTVEQVNAALRSESARVTGMTSGSGYVTLSIPLVADLAESGLLAERLLATGAFLTVMPSFARDSTDLLPDGLDPMPEYLKGEPSSHTYLAAIRAPAAWNLRDWLRSPSGGGARVQVLVADFFGDYSHPKLAAFKSFSGDPTHHCRVGGSLTSCVGNHGFFVAGLVAAVPSSGTDAVGVHPLPERIDLSVVSLPREDWPNMLRRIAAAFPSGNFVLNTSLGFNRGENDSLGLVVSKYEIAMTAATWQRLARPHEKRFVHATSAGNDHEYGDAYSADQNSPFTLAARVGNPCDILDPVIDLSEREACEFEIDRENRTPLTNVVIVGSASARTDELAAYSNRGADVVAVGDQIVGLCVQNDSFCNAGRMTLERGGTSSATPQVAGLAVNHPGFSGDSFS